MLCLRFPYPFLWIASLSFQGTTESGHMLCPNLTNSFSRPGPLLPLLPLLPLPPHYKLFQSVLLPALRSLHYDYCSIRAVLTAREGFSCPPLQTCFHFFYKGWLWRPLNHTVWFTAPVTPFSVLTSVLHSSLFPHCSGTHSKTQLKRFSLACGFSGYLLSLMVEKAGLRMVIVVSPHPKVPQPLKTEPIS